VTAPVWLSGCFAALMLAIAVYCVGRLVASRWWRRPTELDTDASHIVMGVAMAGMLVPGLRVLPATLWEGVFAAGAAWFGYQALHARRAAPATPWRCLHAVPHLVECAAMLYMFLLLPAVAVKGAGISAMTASAAGSRFSFLALLMTLFLLGYVAWLGDRLTVRPAAPAPVLTLAAQPLHVGVPASGATAERAVADPAPAHRPLAPRCAALCKIGIAITMGYMLILML